MSPVNTEHAAIAANLAVLLRAQLVADPGRGRHPNILRSVCP